MSFEIRMGVRALRFDFRIRIPVLRCVRLQYVRSFDSTLRRGRRRVLLSPRMLHGPEQGSTNFSKKKRFLLCHKNKIKLYLRTTVIAVTVRTVYACRYDFNRETDPNDVSDHE